MPLKFLIDEQLRGKFTQALIERGFVEGFPVDVIEVGASDGPPLGIKDDGLLIWGQASGRVIVSLDKNTLPEFLTAHLASGKHSPGVLLVCHSRSWDEVLFYLVLVAAVTDNDEYAGQCAYVPV